MTSMIRTHHAVRACSIVAAAALMLASTACASNDPNAPSLDVDQVVVAEKGAELTLPPGGVGRVPSANLQLHFKRLISDSRCPNHPAIQCVWGGSAAVEIEAGPITGATVVTTVRLEDLAGKDTATVLGTRLRLVRVLPERRSTDSIPLATYRIVLQAGATN